MTNQLFETKQWVTWTSQAGSYSKTKTGRVIAVIPKNSNVREYIKELHRTFGSKFTSSFGGGFSRNHESYLVMVYPKEGSRALPRLYWPRVSNLRLVVG